MSYGHHFNRLANCQQEPLSIRFLGAFVNGEARKKKRPSGSMSGEGRVSLGEISFASGRRGRKTAAFVFTAVSYPDSLTFMTRHLANRIFGPLLALGLLGGCASVKDTAMYYVSYTPAVYPPKPLETPIPILGKAPAGRHTVIGGLKFESDQGWKFMRKSMIYNAQANGADAVVLKATSHRRQISLLQVPPQMDLIPVSNWYRDKKGNVYGGTSWVPYFRPGYVQPYLEEITGIDAEMVVFKK